MSIQPFTDPYIGRCKNIRPSNDGERDTSRRCIEMDGHDSACRFDPLPKPVDRHGSYYTIVPQKSRPWVVTQPAVRQGHES